MDKAALRLRAKNVRRHMSPAYCNEVNQYIIHRLTSHINWADAKSLHVYTAHEKWHEVPTAWLADILLRHASNATITYGEPSLSATIPQGVYDIIIVPLLAFDEACNRLGFGSGWYDRFLANQKQALTIGLAYDKQKITKVPIEPHDIPLDMIITESQVYYSKSYSTPGKT